jgi:hypothetical protein
MISEYTIYTYLHMHVNCQTTSFLTANTEARLP